MVCDDVGLQTMLEPGMKQVTTHHKAYETGISDELTGIANLMAHPFAGLAAANALFVGVASQALGAWSGAVTGAIERSQSFFIHMNDSSSKAVKKPTATVKPVVMDMPAKVDDLKLIAGVGPKLEKVLNDMGIWTYEQIASFTDDDIALLDEKLSLAGRIHRVSWLQQARAFAKA